MRVALYLAGGLLLASGVLAGCSAAPLAPSGEDGPSAASSGRFSGPWADLFDSTYAQATSDDERAALDDEQISAEEYAYFQDKILQCLEGLGVTGHFAGDGSLDYSQPSGVSRDAVQKCNADNGIHVLALRDAIVRNPTHLDESQIMLECLERTGVVGPGYTKADLDNGVDVDTLGASPDFAGCAADPLNYRVD